jgi:hypothetical protein
VSIQTITLSPTSYVPIDFHKEVSRNSEQKNPQNMVEYYPILHQAVVFKRPKLHLVQLWHFLTNHSTILELYIGMDLSL